MKIINLFILSIILFSCSQENKGNKRSNPTKEESSKTQINLENTKWEDNASKGCVDYIEFSSKDSVTIYECPVDEKIYGKYYIVFDTIKVNTTRGQYDNEFPKDSPHRHERYKFSMLLKNDTLFSAKDHKVLYVKSNR